MVPQTPSELSIMQEKSYHKQTISQRCNLINTRPLSANPFASTKFDDLTEESADELTHEDELPALFKDPQRVAMAKALKRNGGR